MRVSARRSNVLSVEIVAFALADTMRERDVVGRVDGNGLCGGVAAAVGIRSRDGVGVRTADSCRRADGGVAPRVGACTRSREHEAVTLTETAAARDTHIRQWVHRDGHIRCGGTPFRVGGCNSIYTALAHADAVACAGVVPEVGDAAGGRERGRFALTDGGVARDGGRR